MILSKLIDGCTWSNNSVIVNNPAEARFIHKLLRELVLDSHLYVTKVTGFYITSVTKDRMHGGVQIARDNNLGDSYLEVMANLQDKVFLSSSAEELKIPLQVGVNTLNDVSVLCNQNPIKTLCVDPYICRVLDSECTLHVSCLTFTGYRSIQQNSGKASKYFPTYTYFNMSDYVRVLPLPPNESIIQLRFYNGYTMELFKSQVEETIILHKSGNVSNKERKWLQSFEQ